MSSQFQGPFLHKPTDRNYWWSEADQCYIFEDGTRVNGPPPPTSSSRGSVRNVPGSAGPSQRPIPTTTSPSNDKATPRFVPPPNVRSTSLSPDQSQRAPPHIPPVIWRKWREGQSFGRGDTIHIHAGQGEPPFERGRHLGSGNYATVIRVEVDDTSHVCALKIYKSRHALERFLGKFENEIHNMRRVSNRHIASFYAAYIYERKNQSPEYGILMQPAADGTLENLISKYRASPSKVTKQHKDILSKAFGCLASALEFIHQHMIRHKDVKSDNILLHNGKLLLADFGSSWDGWSQRSLVTQDPNPKGHTPRYAAPEVMTNEPRSARSDIFSLGGVFYEMFCALEPGATWYDDDDYCKITNNVRIGLRKWWAAPFPEIVPLIYRMLDPQREGRPSARDLMDTLSGNHFCAECCRDLRKVAPVERTSSMAPQPEHMMARLSLQNSQGPAAGSSSTARPYGNPASSGTAAPSARRPSITTPPTSHGPPRNYATRAPTTSSRREVDEEADDLYDSD